MVREMSEDPDERARARRGWAGSLERMVRDHPVITAVMVGCTLVGAGMGFSLLSGEWSVARRVLAGAVGGAGVGLIVTATRMIG